MSFFKVQSLSAIGDSHVTYLQRVFDAAILKQARAAFSEINKRTHIGHDFGQRVWLVNWSTPLRLTQFDLVDVPRLRNRGAKIRRNLMHDAYMRFGLYDSPGAIVESNVFARGFPMNIGESGDGWLEGPPFLENVHVVNNTLEDNWATESAIAVHNSTTNNIVLVSNHCRKNGHDISCL